MSNENVKAYREIKYRELTDKKAILKKQLTTATKDIEGYNSNYLMSLSKNLAAYAVEIARLEGEINVLNQLIPDETTKQTE